MVNMRSTYEGIGIYVGDCKINPINLLGGLSRPKNSTGKINCFYIYIICIK